MRPRTSNKLLPYLAFLFFTAIFIFKLDIFIAQTIYTARNNVNVISKSSLLNPSPPQKNGTFHHQFIVTWGEANAVVQEDGELLTLSLDRLSGSGFQSRKQFLFGRIDMQIKLVSGDSAGTVTTYYMMSRVSPEGDFHDEIDFEFLGNSSGNPYTLHTNVYSQGRGKREQQFFMWFDPTADFHTYSIVWNPKCIIFLVDNIPIREFKNTENIGVPYLKNQPMRIYSSLWNADEWATQHGKVKTNWELAPFTAYYRNFTADVCVWSPVTRKSSCDDRDLSTRAVMNMELDSESRIRMKRLQKKYMVYDYCKDKWRFPRSVGRGECRVN